MKAIILGGIGTKAKHVLKTVNIYKNKGITPTFYQASGLFGNSLYREKIYTKKSNDIINHIKSDNTPYILHCISGSNWLGYEINSKIQAKSIILESSPIEPSTHCFQNFIKVNYNINISKSVVEFLMNSLEIPTRKDDKFNKWYNNNKPSQNTLILAGAMDKLIDINYIKKEYLSSNSNNKLVIFKNSGHCNISKREYEIYKNILENFISE